MKIFTNENNSVVLKLLVAAEISGKDIPIEIVNINDKRFQGPRRLPVLELESGVTLFSSNTAAAFISPSKAEDSVAVEKWLDWEATKLQPAVVHYVGKPETLSQLEELLTELDATLFKSTYLVGKHFSLADICIWVTLYPFYTDEKLRKELFEKQSLHSHIIKWFEALYNIKHFKAAEQKFGGINGLTALQSVAAACWYPTSSSQPQSSPTHEVKAEVISEEEIKLALEAWKKGSLSRIKLQPKHKPVLPVEGEKNVLITSALPYVNNVPHLGNIIGCVLSADAFARYCRARSWNTLFVCGTDEHGTATETKALEEGVTPQQLCDKYFAFHKEIYSWFNISFDQFGRTTTAEQKELVQNLFKECHKNGFTSTSEMDQLFCEKCERFLADRFVEGICPDCKFEDARGDQCDGCGHLINAIDLIMPRCKLCQSTPVIRASEQLFLQLDKIEPWLNDWVEKTADGWSSNAKVITKSWLTKGLKPRCITRDLKWGVPVPLEGFSNKVFYVWFDAPIGYFSITKTYTKDWKKWWIKDPKTNVKLFQFMAKDNVPFHSIMFPATIHASQVNYVTVDHLMATEYLNYEDGKFSKSRGIGVFGNDAVETGIPSDYFRFYLLYIRPESQDSNFSWSDFALKINTELLNNLGNFINRGLMFCEKFYESSIPLMEITETEEMLLAQIRVELRSYITALDKARLREGIKYILNISRHGNFYIQSNKPWELIKGSDDEKKRASTVVGLACNMVGLLTSLLQPYLPETVEKLSQQLQLPLSHFSINEEFQPYFELGHKIDKPCPLFNKILPETAETLKIKYAGRQKSQSPEKTTQPSSTVPNLGSKSQFETAIKSLEEAVTKQGDLVRSLKSQKKSKEEVKPHVDALLDLKNQLASLKKDFESQSNGPTQPTPEKAPGDSVTVGELEAQIAAQGEKVRTLKASADKSVWQPEVNILLNLKKKLAALQGVPAQEQSSGKKKKGKK